METRLGTKHYDRQWIILKNQQYLLNMIHILEGFETIRTVHKRELMCSHLNGQCKSFFASRHINCT